MIRVLQILPWGLKLGGVEATLMSYYRAINRSKVQFDFFVPTENKKGEKQIFEAEAVSLGARIFKHPTSMKYPLRSAIALFQVLRKHKEYKIIHIYARHTVFPALDMFVAKLNGVPIRIVYSCGTETEYPLLFEIFRPMVKLLATHWLAGSTEAGEFMFGKKARERLIISARARDLEAFRYNPTRRGEVREKLELSNFYVIIQVGRLDSNKNHGLIMEAFSRALTENKEMILMIVGEGELLSELNENVNRLQIGDNVRFMGSRDDVADLMQAADILVLPSQREGLPGVAIEAQAAGLPCLLADTITTQVKVTDLVEFLPIDKGIEIWVKRLLFYRGFERPDTSKELRRSGYDIHDAAKTLENFYYEALNEGYDRN
jgi:glycosyltransferase involved in cell wall biosynthesis